MRSTSANWWYFFVFSLVKTLSWATLKTFSIFSDIFELEMVERNKDKKEEHTWIHCKIIKMNWPHVQFKPKFYVFIVIKVHSKIRSYIHNLTQNLSYHVCHWWAFRHGTTTMAKANIKISNTLLVCVCECVCLLMFNDKSDENEITSNENLKPKNSQNKENWMTLTSE